MRKRGGSERPIYLFGEVINGSLFCKMDEKVFFFYSGDITRMSDWAVFT